jgi:hypothetical protein
MIGAHAYGIDHSYKKINKTLAKCLVCGEYSECQILKYEKARHAFFIKIKILDEQFIFDWAKCNHRAVLFDKQDVSRYKQEQIETGVLSVPYYQNMKLRTMEMPKKVSTISIILVVLLGLALGGLLVYLQELFNIPFIP